MNDLLKTALSSDLSEYKSIPFWSWNNNLDENELIKQIGDMKKADIGGFIMHARTGLKDEYLGEKWFSCVGACLKEARRLSMKAWVYDENGWPSGFCGGKLLENEAYRAKFLEYAEGDFDAAAFASYAETADGYRRVTEKTGGVENYHNVYLRVSPANTDILDPKVVDAFIKETHEKYYERFKEYFGKELVGFFTDEPQYYRAATPYTPLVDKVFKKDGEDVRDMLIYLFKHDERGYKFRVKYFGELNRLYCANFYGKIHKWCNEHGCLLTGHSIEEERLHSQMLGGASVMPTYAEEDIPAIDNLGRLYSLGHGSKQVGSVAAQLNKKRVLTETFACSGNDVTPYELKGIGDYQYFNGVNTMCQHLYPYSLARGGKTDNPPVFSPHGNWFSGFKTFNDYFNRLGYIIANTAETPDVAVIEPIRDTWCEYVRGEGYEAVKDIEDGFRDLIITLRNNGVTFHYIDEKLLGRYGSIAGDKLKAGNVAYDKVLVPKMKSIAKTTADILKNFKGKLIMQNRPEFIDGVRGECDLKPNYTLDELISSAKIKFKIESGSGYITARKSEIGDFIFLKNLSLTEPLTAKFCGAEKEYRELDLVTLKESNITDEVYLRPAEGKILIRSENAKRSDCVSVAVDVTSDFKATEITENYLVMDTARIAENGGKYGDNFPIYGLFEQLLRKDYNGELKVKQTFTLNDVMPLTFIMEKAELKSLTVNGNPVTLRRGDFDVYFYEADITDFVKKGENDIEYSIDFYQHDGVRFALFDPLATESLKNMLYFDTSIETSYLRGDFYVESDLSLSKKRGDLPLTKELYKHGYPFFKGEYVLTGKIKKPETGRAILNLSGRFMTAKIEANGKTVNFVTDVRGDIADILKKGENEVKITLNSSLRNLFGPHHYKPCPEPMGVSPYHFEMRGKWVDGKLPEIYCENYNSVPFGVEKIEVICVKTDN